MSKMNIEVSLHDVLKQRVEAGEPIYINGSSSPVHDALVYALAKDTGKTVRVVHIIDPAPLTVEQRELLASAVPADFSGADLNPFKRVEWQRKCMLPTAACRKRWKVCVR